MPIKTKSQPRCRCPMTLNWVSKKDTFHKLRTNSILKRGRPIINMTRNLNIFFPSHQTFSSQSLRSVIKKTNEFASISMTLLLFLSIKAAWLSAYLGFLGVTTRNPQGRRYRYRNVPSELQLPIIIFERNKSSSVGRDSPKSPPLPLDGTGHVIHHP